MRLITIFIPALSKCVVVVPLSSQLVAGQSLPARLHHTDVPVCTSMHSGCRLITATREKVHLHITVHNKLLKGPGSHLGYRAI